MSSLLGYLTAYFSPAETKADAEMTQRFEEAKKLPDRKQKIEAYCSIFWEKFERPDSNIQSIIGRTAVLSDDARETVLYKTLQRYLQDGSRLDFTRAYALAENISDPRNLHVLLIDYTKQPAFNILRALDLASRIKDTNRQKAAFETIILAYIKKPTAELGSRQTIEKAIGETLQHLSPDILGSLAASLTDDFRRLHPAIAEALWSKNKLLENPQVEF